MLADAHAGPIERTVVADRIVTGVASIEMFGADALTIALYHRQITQCGQSANTIVARLTMTKEQATQIAMDILSASGGAQSAICRLCKALDRVS